MAPTTMTVGNKSQATARVRALQATTCTNMSGGLFKGFEQLKSCDLPAGTIHRVLLFTDGYANNGLTKPLEFAEYNSDLYIGGFFGYIVSKNFADKMRKYINTNGVKHGIDYLIKINRKF